MDRSQQEFQRATRITAAASMGSLLVISAFAAGISHAAAPGATPSSPPVASTGTAPPTVNVAKTVARSAVSSSVTATVPACANSYVVRPGDFWLRLAAEAAVDVTALYQANGANSSTPLRAGQHICLPAGAQVVMKPTATTTVAPVAPATTVKRTTTTVKRTVTTTPVTTAHTTRASH